MNKEKALSLLKSRSCKVIAGCLNCKIGEYTTGEISKYGTIYLKEIDKWISLVSLIDIEYKGKMERINWAS